jgi:hypothetical protein
MASRANLARSAFCVARRLDDSIRRLLKDGATEPLFIASDALKAVDETSEPGTQVASES